MSSRREDTRSLCSPQEQAIAAVMSEKAERAAAFMEVSRLGLRRGAASLALGVIGAGLSVGSFGAFTGEGLSVAAAQQQEETPAQRCARQTAEYNQTQAALWKASHPGQELVGQPWPSFVCVDIPTPSVPVPQPGGTTGGAQGPSRTHTWDGFGDDGRQYGDDMNLGSPHTGLADRMGGTPTDTTGASAADSARSNVILPKPWATSVTDGRGGSRPVQVVDTDQGQAVVDDRGVATGEVVGVDPVTGERVVSRVEGLAGRKVGQGEDKSASESASSSATSAPAAPVPGGGGDRAGSSGAEVSVKCPRFCSV